MGVFPNVLRVYNQQLPEGLLEAGMKLISEPGWGVRRDAGNQGGNYGNAAAGA